MCTQTGPAGVMDLVFLNRDQLACALSDGSVVVFSYKEAGGVRINFICTRKPHSKTPPPVVS